MGTIITIIRTGMIMITRMDMITGIPMRRIRMPTIRLGRRV